MTLAGARRSRRAYAVTTRRRWDGRIPLRRPPIAMSAWLLQRNLLDVTVTRIKQVVVLVGSTTVLGQAVRACHRLRTPTPL